MSTVPASIDVSSQILEPPKPKPSRERGRGNRQSVANDVLDQAAGDLPTKNAKPVQLYRFVDVLYGGITVAEIFAYKGLWRTEEFSKFSGVPYDTVVDRRIYGVDKGWLIVGTIPVLTTARVFELCRLNPEMCEKPNPGSLPKKPVKLEVDPLAVAISAFRYDHETAPIYMGFAYKTLEEWRREHKGPKSYKEYNRVWRDKDVIDAWIASLPPYVPGRNKEKKRKAALCLV